MEQITLKSESVSGTVQKFINGIIIRNDLLPAGWSIGGVYFSMSAFRALGADQYV